MARYRKAAAAVVSVARQLLESLLVAQRLSASELIHVMHTSEISNFILLRQLVETYLNSGGAKIGIGSLSLGLPGTPFVLFSI